MGNRAEEFESWLHDCSESDWEQIAAAARQAQVGGWRWEQAWLALDPELRRRISPSTGSGRDPLARAAAAGALAALRAGASLDAEESAVLVAPFRRQLSAALRAEPRSRALRLISTCVQPGETSSSLLSVSGFRPRLSPPPPAA